MDLLQVHFYRRGTYKRIVGVFHNATADFLIKALQRNHTELGIVDLSQPRKQRRWPQHRERGDRGEECLPCRKILYWTTCLFQLGKTLWYPDGSKIEEGEGVCVFMAIDQGFNGMELHRSHDCNFLQQPRSVKDNKSKTGKPS